MLKFFSTPFSFSTLNQGDPLLIYGKALQTELRWLKRAMAGPAVMCKNYKQSDISDLYRVLPPGQCIRSNNGVSHYFLNL